MTPQEKLGWKFTALMWLGFAGFIVIALAFAAAFVWTLVLCAAWFFGWAP